MDKALASTLAGILSDVQRASHAHTCLYIEDSYANLLLVQQLVARRGDLNLLTANTGPLGVKMARDHLPDVIVMDINLPGISGREALKILRADPATATIPVTALSSNAFPKQVEEGLSEGFFRYLTKPFKIAQFNDAIDQMLLHASATRQAASLPG